MCIQTLRGKLCGREVALILCGEAHEDAMDLTRTKSILEPKMGWIPSATETTFDVGKMSHSNSNITLQVAKKWAARAMSSNGQNDDGGLLRFQMQDRVKETGTAEVFLPDQIIMKRGKSEANVQYFLWKDLDPDTRQLHDQKERGIELKASEQDVILARRKKRMRTEGVELFDDWLIRAGCLERPVEIILEGPVPPTELQLHEDPIIPCAPIADPRCQAMELDSGEEVAQEFGTPMRFSPDDGTGTFLEYLRRRVRQNVRQERIHFFELRELGDPEDVQLKSEFQKLVRVEKPDLEEEWLKELGFQLAKAKRVPSWEAFFGAASELLYFSPHIKADYVPFLACVLQSHNLRPKDRVLKFFQHLYCGLISDAIAMLNSDSKARGFLRLRSLVHWNGQGFRKRQDVRSLIPVLVAPVDSYLKAKISSEPRTWVSALAQRLCEKVPELVDKAQRWYLEAAEKLLDDVKTNDQEGDYFLAWLREAHRDIFDDIETGNVSRLGFHQVPSISKPFRNKLYNLKEIRIPSFDEAMREILSYREGKATSTRRQRVLAKIIIDVFQLRMVDLASILIVMDRALAFPEGSEVVIIMYAGGDHTQTIEKTTLDHESPEVFVCQAICITLVSFSMADDCVSEWFFGQAYFLIVTPAERQVQRRSF
eukprot:symbB.v1.2.035153.t1/scaffold4672.1/size36684/2